MPQPKPLRDTYDITKETKKDLKNSIKPLMNYAVRGNEKFIGDIAKLNWSVLPSKDVFAMIIMLLSYGLKNHKKIFEDYIKKENMKSTVSLFRLMNQGDGLRVKNCLNTDSFITIFNTLFADEKQSKCEKTLENISRRVAKIRSNDFSVEDKKIIEILIKSIIQGKEEY